MKKNHFLIFSKKKSVWLSHAILCLTSLATLRVNLAIDSASVILVSKLWSYGIKLKQTFSQEENIFCTPSHLVAVHPVHLPKHVDDSVPQLEILLLQEEVTVPCSKAVALAQAKLEK